MNEEEKIKQIAEVLKNTLLLSDNEALNKAKEMYETEQKFKKSMKEKGVKANHVIVPGFDDEEKENQTN